MASAKSKYDNTYSKQIPLDDIYIFCHTNRRRWLHELTEHSAQRLKSTQLFIQGNAGYIILKKKVIVIFLHLKRNQRLPGKCHCIVLTSDVQLNNKQQTEPTDVSSSVQIITGNNEELLSVWDSGVFRHRDNSHFIQKVTTGDHCDLHHVKVSLL